MKIPFWHLAALVVIAITPLTSATILVIDDFNTSANNFNGERGSGCDMQDEMSVSTNYTHENWREWQPQYAVSSNKRQVDYSVYLGNELMGGSERIEYRQQYYHHYYNDVMGRWQYAMGYTYWYSSFFDQTYGTLSNAVLNNQYIDITPYDYFCFWIKGAGGGEEVAVSLTWGGISYPTTHVRSTRGLPVNNYLSGGITTDWQFVKIPIVDWLGTNGHDKIAPTDPTIEKGWNFDWTNFRCITGCNLEFAYHIVALGYSELKWGTNSDPSYYQNERGVLDGNSQLPEGQFGSEVYNALCAHNNSGTIWIDHMFLASENDITPTNIIYTNNSVLQSVSVISPIMGNYTNIDGEDVFRDLATYPDSGTSVVFGVQLLESAPITIDVYDIEGNLVRSLEKDDAVSGNNYIAWDIANESGTISHSGIYIAVIKAEGSAGTEKARLTFVMMK